MSTMSEFFSSGGGGGVGLGLSTVFPMYGSTSGLSPVVLGTQTFLSSGTYTAPANADAAVQAMDHLKLYNTTQSSSAVMFRGATVVASNGSGTCVAVSGEAGVNNVSYSTDNGATWTTVAVGGTSAWNSVVWTGTHFVVAGIPGTTTNAVYRSTDGSTWTAATITLNSTTMTCTGLVDGGGGNLLYLTGGAVGYHYYSTNNGSSWTQFSPNQSGTLYSGFALGSTWVLFNGSSTYYTSTFAAPQTQTSRTAPAAGFGPNGSQLLMASNLTSRAVVASSASLYQTTDGVNWSQVLGSGWAGSSRIFYNGSYFYYTSAVPAGTATTGLPSVVYRTADFSSYSSYFLIPNLIGSDSPATQYFGGAGSDNRVFFCSYYNGGSQTRAVRYWTVTSTPDFIGTAVATLSATGGSNLYWRIK
jgi:hypothetical protein